MKKIMKIRQIFLKNYGNKYHRYFFIALIAVMVSISAWSYILAATVSDTFTSEAKIGKGTSIVAVDTSGYTVTLPTCYTANTQWNFVATTTARDIDNPTTSTATVQKDIYCDGPSVTASSNCVLWTYSAGHNTPAIPATVCIASNSNVYANILWAGGDTSSSKTWGPASGITAGDLDGPLLPTNFSPGGNYGNLARYYTSAAGTYLAMDACKAKGSGWRLSTIKELESIRDKNTGAGPYSRLPGIVSSSYWSSTEYSSTSAWYMAFSNDFAGNYTKSGGSYVRCVRGY